MKSLLDFFYEISIWIVFILYFPILIYKLISKKISKREFKQRLGFIDGLASLESDSVIWVHAASVGETKTISKFVKEIKDTYPNKKILFSTFTSTGQRVAKKELVVDKVIYLPLDLSLVINRVIKRIKPEALILMETELWPNLIKKSAKVNTKIMLVSGRISDDGYEKYKFFRVFFKQVLKNVNLFSMQSQVDKERIIKLGANENKVVIAGNLKFSQSFFVDNADCLAYLKDLADEKVFIAGSTHQGEEEQLIASYYQLKQEFSELKFVLAPRYIKRSDQLEQLLAEYDFKVVKRTELEANSDYDVLLVDTLGELAQLYTVGDIIFVGGSLIKRGGHNILEVIAQGKAVFFGPNMSNFKAAREFVLTNEIGFEINDGSDLYQQASNLLAKPKKLNQLENKAAELMDNSEVIDKNIALLKDLLKQKILFVRLSAIGDVIHSLPALNLLKQAYPQAEISWVVEPKAEAIIKDNPNIKNVISFPKNKWKDEFKADKRKVLQKIKEFSQKLKGYNFDLVVDVHGLFKSGLVTFLSGAKQRFGPAKGREGSKLFYTNYLKAPEKKLHQVDKNLALIKDLTAKTTDEPKFEIVIEAEIKQSITELLASYKLEQKDFIVINPFSSWDSKDWFKSRYAKLADRLITELEINVIFTGSPADKKGIADILAKMEHQAYNFAGKTDLKELAELYQRANLFIGVDTGPMHLAVAVGTKTIALMGPTTSATHGPYGEQHLVVQKNLDCIECWDRKCKLKNNQRQCMREISVEEVRRAVDS